MSNAPDWRSRLRAATPDAPRPVSPLPTSTRPVRPLPIGAATPFQFFVTGVPQPGGSKKGFIVERKGKGGKPGRLGVAITDDAKHNKSWRELVKMEANRIYRGFPMDVPLRVTMEFFMPRPKNHYRTGKFAGQLKPDAPAYPGVKPDVLKLARSTEDALTKIVWTDDNKTVRLVLSKDYGKTPGVRITVEVMPTIVPKE